MADLRLSVVIPTRDRLGALRDTLAALDAQDCPADAVEVVVVDNGSSDGTPGAVRAREGRLPLVVVEQPKPGPAAARNAGTERARAPVVLFLGDDMRPAAPDLLAGHLARHAADPSPGYGVVGRVRWRPDLPVTPFMHWLEHGGPQFAFDSLAAGPVETARHFYTSQVSVKRELLERVGGFDERFPSAAVEDIELGLRLQRAGLALDYRPELLVEHDHPQQPRGFADRQARAGAAARLMHATHGDHGLLPAPRWTWPLLAAAERPLRALASRGGPRVWEPLAMAAYVRGWRAADRQA